MDEQDVVLDPEDDLKGTVPADYVVTTPDAKRIEGFLRDTFGDR